MRVAEVLEQLGALPRRSIWVRGVLSLEVEARELRDGTSRSLCRRRCPLSMGVKSPCAARSIETGQSMGLWPPGLVVDHLVKPNTP
jgi:hypothetical protein